MRKSGEMTLKKIITFRDITANILMSNSNKWMTAGFFVSHKKEVKI